MKQAIFSFLLMLCTTAVFAQQKESKSEPDPAKKVQEAEAACGQCKFGLKGKGCTLAVRMEGKAYFVEGSAIDSHGDAHAGDGFCNKIRKAKVQGEVVNERFKATYFGVVKEGQKGGVKNNSLFNFLLTISARLNKDMRKARRYAQ